MSASTIWQCPSCGEQHPPEFDTCWKCGADPAGDPDPDFHVAESPTPTDQAPESPDEEAELPPPELPAITYYSIPPYIWVCLGLGLQAIESADRREVEFWPSPLLIVFLLVSYVVIGIPIVCKILRAQVSFFIWFSPGVPRRDALTELVWMLSMFRLPESIRRSQRWFVPVYYGSIAASLIAPLGYVAWLMIRSL